MDKKITLVTIPVVLLLVWAVASWYLGQQTQTALQSFIVQQNQQLASLGLNQELVSYEKHLFNATAITRMSLTTPGIPAVIDEILLRHDITSGPVLIGGNTLVRLGLARIDTQVALDQLDETKRQWFTTSFAGQKPLDLNTFIGFNQSAVYNLTVNPMTFTQEGTIYGWQKAYLQGSSNVQDLIGQVELNQLVIKQPDTTYTLPKANIAINTSELQGTSPAIQANIQALQLAILAEGTTQPFITDLTAQLDGTTQNNSLNGKLTIDLNNIKGMKDAFQQVKGQLAISHLNIPSLQTFFNLQTEVRNLTKQVDWNAEALEMPEGQQKQQELMNTINSKNEQAIDILFNQVLKSGQSQVKTMLQVDSLKGKLQSTADLIYASQEKLDLMKVLDYRIIDWLGLFKGKLTLQVDKAALPEGVENLLSPYVQQRLLKATNDKLTSAIEFKDDAVDLNGQTLTRAQWTKLIAPALENDSAMTGVNQTARDLGIPPDLMQMIDKQGLTPEIMQLLEESDDVPPETVAILKQLQQSQPAKNPITK